MRQVLAPVKVTQPKVVHFQEDGIVVNFPRLKTVGSLARQVIKSHWNLLKYRPKIELHQNNEVNIIVGKVKEGGLAFINW